jgi:hypothetical protein
MVEQLASSAALKTERPYHHCPVAVGNVNARPVDSSPHVLGPIEHASWNPAGTYLDWADSHYIYYSKVCAGALVWSTPLRGNIFFQKQELY